jgi:hypothetical protein
MSQFVGGAANGPHALRDLVHCLTLGVHGGVHAMVTFSSASVGEDQRRAVVLVARDSHLVKGPPTDVPMAVPR